MSSCKITTRVQIVDDSSVMRLVLSDLLSSDPTMEVVDMSTNGREALDKLESMRPDVILLDVEMPVMGGLEALREIRRRQPALPVIMVSAQTSEGAATTLEALALGASDYVAKPTASGSACASLDQVRTDLLPKIHGLCRDDRFVAEAPVGAVAADRKRRSRRRHGAGERSVEVVAVGVSTGGPNALHSILPRISGNLAAPVLVVQHMPPEFTALLAERLDDHCELHVREAAGGEVARGGDAWIAPGGRHLQVTRRGTDLVLVVDDGPPENSCRPSVDRLFRSVAATCGAGSLGVMLTGMGADGYLGCRHIHDARGSIVAQDEASSVVWGMPRRVIEAGLVDDVLSLDEVADEVMARVGYGAREGRQ